MDFTLLFSRFFLVTVFVLQIGKIGNQDGKPGNQNGRVK